MSTRFVAAMTCLIKEKRVIHSKKSYTSFEKSRKIRKNPNKTEKSSKNPEKSKEENLIIL